MSLYLISYMREDNKNILPSDGSFLMPLIQIGSCFFRILGGILEAKFGAKKLYYIKVRVIFLGNCVFLLGNSIIYLTKKLELIYVGMFIYGCGIGINVSIFM